ncbi:hypothetical protein SEVIR_4G243300v4 [Setaria viridis]|uniref:Uncharacterized protein n=1 Tax=Setaria viridis TaxID=4556 RepID=A0A4U6V443_SETVI|nr:hypothetical protein SEVIR_4G243300v2 [Setaria viridis]
MPVGTFLRIPVKAQFRLCPKLLFVVYILARRVWHANCCVYLVAYFCPLQLAEHTAEQQKCRQTSALAGFVSSFLSSVYWSFSQLATASAHLLAVQQIRTTLVHHRAVHSHLLVISTERRGSLF